MAVKNKEKVMKHYYSTVDGVIMTHSDMEHGEMGRKVRVHFERPNGGESDFAEGYIPSFEFNRSCGFNQNELLKLQRYLRNNSFLIWEYAEKGGGEKCLKS